MGKYNSAVVCSQHPELNGLRWSSNRKCIKCDAERVAATKRRKRADDSYRIAENARAVERMTEQALEMKRVRSNRAVIWRRTKYAEDPVFREKEKERCRLRLAAKRAAQKAAQSLARETPGDQSRTIVPPVPPVV